MASDGGTEKRSGVSRALVVGLPILGLAVLVWQTWSQMRDAESERLQHAFESHAQETKLAVQRALDAYVEIVWGISGLFDASEVVDRDEFHAFVVRGLERRPGIRALVWVPRVPAAARATMEQAARAEGVADYAFRRWQADGTWPREPDHWAATYYPMYFLASRSGYEIALGIDLGSSDVRRAALHAARDGGHAVATAPIRLVAGESASGQLLIVPIFRKGAATTSASQRQAALIGYGVGVFAIEEIVAATLEGSGQPPDLAFTIHDDRADGEPLIFDNGQQPAPGDDAPGHAATLQFGGRSWRVEARATSGWVEQNRGRAAWIVGVAGILLTVLSLAFLVHLTGQTRRVQDEVARRTAELATANDALLRSNLELKEYAYVASHDLKAPLRAISGFAEFLEMDHAESLDASGLELLSQIQSGAARMQALIVDLLELSRVEGAARPFTPVALDGVLQTASENLHASIEETDGMLSHDDLPTVQGDRFQLVQLFQNLVGNALKFHGDAPPRVHVSARDHADGVEVRVQDHGIGIAPEKQREVFRPFRRLHGRTAYPGTGIGLAICERVVSRHGGEIRVESTAGGGATFVFTLPTPPASA